MAKDTTPWQHGRAAWNRLRARHQDDPAGSAAHAQDADGALRALDDIGQVRHLLDQAELSAVRIARRHNRSWAEIATRLGVTRQSAWERWRELDEGGTPSADDDEVGLRPAADSAADLLAQPTEPTELTRRAARQRRGSTVVVLNVIGMSWEDGRAALLGTGLKASGSDPDGLPLEAAGWPHGTVTDQSPESGARIPPGSTVRLWIERGGGSGVREPRRPRPEPRVGRQLLPETQDEAVG